MYVLPCGSRSAAVVWVGSCGLPANANMFFIPLGMMQGAEITVGQMLWANLLPATLGNIAGGALFVGIVHYYLNKKIKNLRDSA